MGWKKLLKVYKLHEKFKHLNYTEKTKIRSIPKWIISFKILLLGINLDK